MVLDSFDYGGYLFCARGTVWFCLPIVPSASCNFSFYFRVVDDGPYRFSTANSPECGVEAHTSNINCDPRRKPSSNVRQVSMSIRRDMLI